MRSRSLITPTRAVCGLVLLATLVVGGLAWVSVTALRVESAERVAAVRADRNNRERLALWRLDSHMLTPLGVENNRPFNNFSALAPPALLVFDDAGFPIANPGNVASPLLSAELPSWVRLHFQLDPTAGWTSPQVLPPSLVANLQGEPLGLPLFNCTLQRVTELNDLRRLFPVDHTVNELIRLDQADPDSAPYVALVPLSDEPASAKPAPSAWPVGSTGRRLHEAEARAPSRPTADLAAMARGFAFELTRAGRLAETGRGARSRSQPDAVSGIPAPGPAMKQAEQLPIPNPLFQNAQRQVLEAGVPPDVKARKDSAQYAGRGGGYVPQFGGTRMAQAPAGPGRGYGPPPPAPIDASKQNAPPGIPPLPPPVDEQQQALELNLRNTTEWAQKQSKLIQNRSKLEAENLLQELKEGLGRSKEGIDRLNSFDAKKGLEVPGGKADAVAQRSAGVWCAAACKPASAAGEHAAEPKSAPVVVPVTVRFGPLRPRRLTAGDGTEYLFLARPAVTDSRIVYQGVLVDWPLLRAELTALVADLFPQADLSFVADADAAPLERTMTTLPVRLDVGGEPSAPECGWTPLRFGLVIAWAAAVLAIVAVAVGGRAVLAMSDRRVRFASAVTHELRTPLTALQLHLDLLNSGLVTDEAKKGEYLTTIATEADRLNRLVGNVLDFARLENRSAATSARPVAVAELLATVDRTWADRLRGEGFELIVGSTAPPDRCVTADPRVLEQVLGNLIDNARKYAKAAADRRIWVRAEPADRERVAIEVEDRGPGVPAAERRSIFQPFTRGSGTTDTGGAGLGLNLAKEWAEQFGGSLTYRPAAGGCGACFRLELPATRS